MTTKDHSLATGDAVSVHRICIRSDRDGDPVAVDVALPSGIPVGELMPAVVDLVDVGTAAGTTVHGWRLDRPTGGALIESLSLSANDVHDGELLILTTARAAALGVVRGEPCREVAATPPSAQRLGRWLPEAICLLSTTLAALALAATGVTSHTPTNLIVAAVGACAAAGAAFATGGSTALSVAAVALASATGFLAVPSGPALPNVFLAATAGFTASLLAMRLSGRLCSALIAIAALSLLIAAATVAEMSVVAIGVVLSTTSLALLALAPRITVLTAGLGPERWSEEIEPKTATARATLTGLLAGCATGTALGATAVATAGLRHGAPPHGTAAFAALLGLVLILRSRTYVDPSRQIALIAGGLTSCIAGLCVAAVFYREYVGWISGVLVAVGLVAARRPRISAATSRHLDRLEYAALAAVAPVAVWVGGAFAFVREVYPS